MRRGSGVGVVGLGTLRHLRVRAPEVPRDEVPHDAGPFAVTGDLPEFGPVLVRDTHGACGGVGLSGCHVARLARVCTSLGRFTRSCTYKRHSVCTYTRYRHVRTRGRARDRAPLSQHDREETKLRIRRTPLKRDFLAVPNGTVRDARLSHMARGCLVEMLSRPDGWKVTADDMWRESVAARGKDSPGRRQFRSAFAELRACGYLVSARVPLPGGRFGTMLTLHDLPASVPVVSDDVEEPASGDVEAPGSGAAAEDESGTSARPAAMGISAGQPDVPFGGTLNRKRVKEENRNTKTPTTGRRPSNVSTGAGSGGCAATGGFRGVEVSAVGEVIRWLPLEVREQLPDPVPSTLVKTIRTQLDRGLTVDQLIDRVCRRWQAHVDRRWKSADLESVSPSMGGTGLDRPVGAAVALLRAGKCASPRCDDGRDLDTAGPCRTCERDAEDRRAQAQAAQAPTQGTFPTSLPSLPAPRNDGGSYGAGTGTTVLFRPASRRDAAWRPLVNCDGCDLAHRPKAPGKLCPGCRAERMAQASAGAA